MLLRWIVGLPVAALATALLFLVMTYLIDQEFAPQAKTTPVIDEIIVTPKKKKRRDPEKPPRVDEIETPEPIELEPFEKSDLPGDNSSFRTPPGPDRGPDPDGPGDLIIAGPSIPIPPPYPERCVQRGAEGVVIVEFDVTARGEVVNARIVSSPDGCFDRPVLRAVEKWRYAPQVIDGELAARQNVREQFRFQLNE